MKTLLQVDSIDEPLKNRLWNSVLDDFFKQINDNPYYNSTNKEFVYSHIWKEFFGKRIDLIPRTLSRKLDTRELIDEFSKWFFAKAQWFAIYDFIECLVELDTVAKTGFTAICNKSLEKELSAYRIIKGRIVQITSSEEVEAIEDALHENQAKSVVLHLKTALDLLADRQSPDYRNSIKESISAIEAFCKIVTGDDKATLGKALAVLERQHGLHGSLKEAYGKIYGYASDASGIRHSMLEDSVYIDFADAKFMLVSCSAFINYLKAKLQLKT